MTNVFNKILVVVALLVFSFGVISYFSGANTMLETVSAFGSSESGGCCGGGSSSGGGGGNEGSSGESSSRLPTCTLSASPFSIKKGESATLTWKTTDARTATIDGGVGSVGLSGSKTVSPQVSTTYKMTVSNGFGKNSTCVTQVLVTEPPLVRTCDLTANVTKVNKGEKVTLTWVTKNLDSVTINGEQVAKSGSKSYVVNTDTTFKLVAKTADGKNTCTQTVVVACVVPVAPLPTCTLKLNPTTITRGESTTLTWTSKNGTSATLGGEQVSLSGSKVVSPVATHTYSFTVKNKDGKQENCQATITVNEAPKPTPVPTCTTFTANPLTIKKGGETTLSWTTKDATRVTINNGVGEVAKAGSVKVKPQAKTTYTLTAHGANNQNHSCYVTVEVTNPEPPAETIPVCESFVASPTSLPYSGGKVTLEWKTKDATEVSINNGIGKVSLTGYRDFNVTKTTNFVLTAKDNKGKEVTCQAKVLVAEKPTPEPTPISCAADVTFNTNSSSINRGESAKLTWNTSSKIKTVKFDQNIKSTAKSGTVTVSPDNSTTYTLTASDGKNTIDCPVTVNVKTSTGGGGGGYAIPRCELEVSSRKISAGQTVKLSWNVSHASRMTLKDNHGKTLISATDRRDDDLFESDLVVKPTKNTTYTLIADNGSRKKECVVDVVVGGLTVLEDRDQQPIIGGISLEEVPYTGFEAGPVLTTLFYMLLAAWAGYLAYFFTIGRKEELATAAVLSATPAVPVMPSLMVNDYQKPDFHKASATPTNLPTNVNAPVVGYANVEPIAPVVAGVAAEVAKAIEDRANDAHVLLSSDAMRSFVNFTEGKNRMEILDTILENVKGDYPTEDGWIILNEERMAKQCAACLTPAMPSATNLEIGAGSLAEAIVTGDVVNAYQLIGHRPMIALADAAADLDAAYRAKTGEDVTISNLLARETANLSPDALQDAIKALTGALDGTYNTEEEAVKMAIMKAVKALA